MPAVRVILEFRPTTDAERDCYPVHKGGGDAMVAVENVAGLLRRAVNDINRAGLDLAGKDDPASGAVKFALRVDRALLLRTLEAAEYEVLED